MSQQNKVCNIPVLHVIIILQHKVISDINVLNVIKFYVKLVRIVNLDMVLLCEYLFIILANIIIIIVIDKKYQNFYYLYFAFTFYNHPVSRRHYFLSKLFIFRCDR